jgi:hypothetical protein
LPPSKNDRDFRRAGRRNWIGPAPALPSFVGNLPRKTLVDCFPWVKIVPAATEVDGAIWGFDCRLWDGLFRVLLLIVMQVSAVSPLQANNNVKARSFGGGL